MVIPKRRLAIFVNPFSGKKKASHVYSKYLQPILNRSHCDVVVHETLRPGHAREIALSFDIHSFDGIVCVSGDGLLWEVVNGIMSRSDWRTAIKVPLGIIPAGSGNGLAHTLGIKDPLEASICVARGVYRPIDIFSAFQTSPSSGKINRFYCFLTVSWAMLADVDIGSENLRWMGELRFLHGIVKRLTLKRKYRARFSYIPFEDSAQDEPKKLIRRQDMYDIFHHRTDVHLHRVSSYSNLKGKASSNNSQEPPSPSPPVVDVLEDGPDCSFVGPHIHLNSSDGEWRVIEDEFIVFLAANVASIGADVHAAPFAQLADGAIDIIMVRNCSRLQLLSAFSNLDKGGHVEHEFTEYFKVKAFKFEPLTPGSFLAVDGERVDYCPVEVEVHRALANVMCM